MIIGALFGRLSPEEDDQPANSLATEYRRRFLETFGYTQCGELREKVVGASGVPDSCGQLVEGAAGILLRVLTDAMYAALDQRP